MFALEEVPQAAAVPRTNLSGGQIQTIISQIGSPRVERYAFLPCAPQYLPATRAPSAPSNVLAKHFRYCGTRAYAHTEQGKEALAVLTGFPYSLYHYF